VTRRAAPILSPEARADLASITRHIAKESGAARAGAVKARIVRGIKLIAQMPNAGRLRDDLPDQPRSSS
jgi:plasmid stabilization system protein ParE